MSAIEPFSTSPSSDDFVTQNQELASLTTDFVATSDEAHPAEPQNKSSLLRFVFDVLETLIISLILFAGVNLISARIRVEGFSMEPTFHNGELVIVNKLAYSFSSPQRGDVVIFHYPRNPKEEFIKRIIGLPGEQISVRDGKVYVEGQKLEEAYIASPPDYQFETIVPEGELFVLGDNRNNSSDSHSWGSLPIDMIVGKATFIYWPPPNIGVVEHFTVQEK